MDKMGNVILARGLLWERRLINGIFFIVESLLRVRYRLFRLILLFSRFVIFIVVRMWIRFGEGVIVFFILLLLFLL